MSTFRYSITEITDSGYTNRVHQADSIEWAIRLADALAESKDSELRIAAADWVYVRKDRKWAPLSRHNCDVGGPDG